MKLVLEKASNDVLCLDNDAHALHIFRKVLTTVDKPF